MVAAPPVSLLLGLLGIPTIGVRASIPEFFSFITKMNETNKRWRNIKKEQKKNMQNLVNIIEDTGNKNKGVNDRKWF